MVTQTTVPAKATRQALYDTVEAQIHTFEAQVATLKAKAESAKADAELAAIANLATPRRALDQKVAQLKSAGENAFQHLKGDLESGLAAFDKSVQAIASKLNAR